MNKDNEEFEDEDLEFIFGNDKSKIRITYEDIRSILYNSIMILFYLFYKIKNTQIYRKIHIGVMILWAVICWTVALGQYDIKIMDGEGEKIIFHLPNL